MPETRKTIAHIMPWPCVGGVERATARMVRWTEGDEFRNIAFCLKDARPVREMFEQEGVDVIEYEAAEPSYRHPKDYLCASRQLARKLKEHRIDLMHCADLLAAHRSTLAGILTRVPLISHIRGRFEDISRRDRSFLLPVKRFVFVSENTMQAFGHEAGAGRGAVIYDGIDVKERDEHTGASVRAEFDIPPDAKIVGMVARIAPAKDYPTLIRAAARVCAIEPRVRFLIVGEHSGVEAYREHFEEVKRLIEEHNLAPYFIFTDFREDVQRLTAAMDVFVLSTHMEGLPLVILEAMAQGRAVVATDVGGIPEIVHHGETGLLAPHEDDERLAAHLIALLNDEEKRERIGSAGCEFVKSNFSRETFVLGMTSLYREVLGLKQVSVERERARSAALVEDV
ncbi:MAG TPA: glycosyltransferase family 4 protein [Pyrinomonadaceae bacterium]|nr:glycosyltransferase family 4 protein [Pyrinomonadaceae bacterium]